MNFLNEIMLLDKVQKNKDLEEFEIKTLRKKGLIEGRKPNFHISANIAAKIGEEEEYMDMKGIDDEYCRKIIVEYLTKFGKAKRSDLAKVLVKHYHQPLSKATIEFFHDSYGARKEYLQELQLADASQSALIVTVPELAALKPSWNTFI